MEGLANAANPSDRYPAGANVAVALGDLAERIASDVRLDAALSDVLESAAGLLGAATASILLLQHVGVPVSRRLTTRGQTHPLWENSFRSRRRAIAAEVARTGKALVIHDQIDGNSALTTHDAGVTWAAVPVRYGQDPVGVVVVEWLDHRACGPSELRLLETLAAYAAIAVDQARLREARRHAEAEADAAHSRLQRFISIVAQDLREPLVAVVTSVEILRESRPHEWSEIRRRLLPAIEKATYRIQQLADELMNAAKIGTGRFSIDRFPMDLVEAVRHVVDQQQKTTDRHRLVLTAPDQLRGAWDHQRVTEMMTSLIANAITYSPDGGDVRVVVDQVNGAARISVSDTGVGIPPEQIPHLFQLFSRLQPDLGHGAGLALYIAKAIVDGHGGRIWAESQREKGTTFYVTLPMTEDLPTVAAEDFDDSVEIAEPAESLGDYQDVDPGGRVSRSSASSQAKATIRPIARASTAMNT